MRCSWTLGVPDTQVQRPPAKMPLMREITIATSLALVSGLAWKTYHWNTMRRMDDWYAKYNKGEISPVKN